jgi:D-3-phosphoglycerate dehydrogenase / 2-oxoglutarate reductase
MKKALITEEFHPDLTLGLEELGFDCNQQWEYTTVDVKNCIAEFEVLVVNSKILVDNELLSRANKLKAVIRIGSGLEIIDQEACKNKNILVISTPEGNANAVAEHVLGFLLSSYNNLFRAQNEMLQGQWHRETNRGEELSSKVLAVIGCGNNGAKLVELLTGFQTEILVYDIVDISGKILNPRARQVEMDEIYRRADVISFHIPLNKDTRHLVCFDFLKKFNKSIDLVNTSRGGLCKEEDLWHAMNIGKVRRAMLDVYEREPFTLSDSENKLVMEGRLHLTPHIAGWTKESKKRMADLALTKLKTADFL